MKLIIVIRRSWIGKRKLSFYLYCFNSLEEHIHVLFI